MKKYSFFLDKWQVDDFFIPIRSKQDVIRLLMKSIKLMLIGNQAPEEKQAGELVLIVSKMSRLFFFSKEKSFSVSFPFHVTQNKDTLEFSSKTIREIDHKITSDVLGILSQHCDFDKECALEFIEPIIDIAKNEEFFWPFLLYLFLFEDGYIRYDYDEKNNNGDYHPLNHLDLYYSSYSTCKIGLRESLEPTKMIDLLRTETICHYIEKQSHK
ncbi:hypothetical protein [Thiothrix lacustris]|uniref:hypothetical protein n=1 Tax=Thiothrix lacustris TaxID=525917 RepID=UPI0027E51CBC|nr:hypothetical protein [Thiothrix lacustris]WMP18483.1 hypothetical protein RCS87_05335 [Thiothrix lacustris]